MKNGISGNALAIGYELVDCLPELTGTVIGPHDLMIASIALAHNHTLVTHDIAEFTRVRGLTVEDWEQ